MSSEAAAESFRVREVQKYRHAFVTNYLESGAAHGSSLEVPEIASTQKSSPSTALTAWLQLLALRLDVQRAMISLVDKADQLLLAESTSTTQLDHVGLHDQGETDLWVGCSTTPRDVALCAYTIQAEAAAGQKPCFTVGDLSKDPRFCDFPYVKDAPFLRFYGGVPLVSPSGVRIGAIFAIDDKAHGPLTKDEVDLLTVMGKNVMDHLEMLRQNDARKRHVLMSRGIAAFVENKSRIPQDWQRHWMQERIGTNAQHASSIDQLENATDADRISPFSAHGPENGHWPVDTKGRQSTPETSTGTLSQADVLARASNILRESLDVNYTVFCDASSSLLFTADDTSQFSLDGLTSADRTEDVSDGANRQQAALIALSTAASNSARESQNRGRNPKTQKLAQILSFSKGSHSSAGGDAAVDHCFNPMLTQRFVSNVQERYPNGTIWSFDENGSLSAVEAAPLDLTTDDASSSTTSGEQSDFERDQDDNRMARREAARLIECFPKARQILYAPFYNAGHSNSSKIACFAVSLREVPVFTSDVEIAFVRAFVNSVAVECNRVETALADRQKGDFISSISHELRTPLHGILATADALSECATDKNQEALCDTLSKCGRMLLDTITHVLEYSKINTFRNANEDSEQSRRRSLKPSKRPILPLGRSSHEVSSLWIDSWTDMALICEEVVEVVASKEAQDPSPQPEDVLSPGELAEALLPESSKVFTVNKAPLPSPVIVILDIAPADWFFFCTPGAIRRILLNLVGNSLKYTKSGYVKVELSQDDLNPPRMTMDLDDAFTTTVILKVTDTGKGISPEFLRDRLFTPFTQESSLDAGTGLGLSMVKNIVDMLQGTIKIGSSNNVGTVVEVRLPLKRLAAGSMSPTLAGLDPHLRVQQDEINRIRAQFAGRSISLYGFDLNPYRPLADSIHQYAENWFRAKMKKEPESGDVVVVNGPHLEEFLALPGTSTRNGTVLICCEAMALKGISDVQSLTKRRLIPLLQPLGPHRLAKGLLACLEATPLQDVQPSNGAGVSTSPSSFQPTSQYFETYTNHGGLQRDRSSGEDGSTEPTQTGAGAEDSMTRIDLNGKEAREVEGGALLTVSQPRILCVDDNTVNLNILKRYMSKLNYTNVETAQDGLAAYESARRQVPGFNFIFMDLSMPVWDGFRSTRAIRDLEKQRCKDLGPDAAPEPATIIAVTALGSSRDQSEAFSAGVDKFVTKPLKLANLKALIEQPRRQEQGGL